MSNPRVCKDCGGKESDIIPFYDNRHERICTKCLSIRNKNKYAEEKREKEKRKEIVSQPVSSECVKLPSANPTEVTRYNAIHALSDKAKKEARGRVVDALMEYFAGKDKSTVTQRDIEKAVQCIASTGDNQSVTNWYMVILRVSRSDSAAFRWRALFRDWQKAISQGSEAVNE